MLGLLAQFAAATPLLHTSEPSKAVEVVARDAQEPARSLEPTTLEALIPGGLSVPGADTLPCMSGPLEADGAMRGRALLDGGRSAEARAVLRRATAGIPCTEGFLETEQLVEIWLLAGAAAELEGDPDAAAAAYRQARTVDSGAAWDETLGASALFDSAEPWADTTLLPAPGLDGVRVDGTVFDAPRSIAAGVHIVQTETATLAVHLVPGGQRWVVQAEALPDDLVARIGEPEVESLLRTLLAGERTLFVESNGRTLMWDGAAFQPLAHRRSPALPLMLTGGALAAGGGALAYTQYERGLELEALGAAAIDDLDPAGRADAEAQWVQARQLVAVGVTGAAIGVGVLGTGALLLTATPSGVVLTVRR